MCPREHKRGWGRFFEYIPLDSPVCPKGVFSKGDVIFDQILSPKDPIKKLADELDINRCWLKTGIPV